MLIRPVTTFFAFFIFLLLYFVVIFLVFPIIDSQNDPNRHNSVRIIKDFSRYSKYTIWTPLKHIKGFRIFNNSCSYLSGIIVGVSCRKGFIKLTRKKIPTKWKYTGINFFMSFSHYTNAFSYSYFSYSSLVWFLSSSSKQGDFLFMSRHSIILIS